MAPLAPASSLAAFLVVDGSDRAQRGTVIGVDTMRFDEFFKENYERVVRSLTAGFGAEAGVEEAVQEAFVRAHSRWRRVRTYDAPAAWVRRVAINLIHDQRRSTTRRHAAEERSHRLNERLAAPTYDRSGRLVGALAALPERQRLAMALYYVEDLSVREIAASMELTEGSVKAHLSQGRANLSRHMTPEGDTEAGSSDA